MQPSDNDEIRALVLPVPLKVVNLMTVRGLFDKADRHFGARLGLTHPLKKTKDIRLRYF